MSCSTAKICDLASPDADGAWKPQLRHNCSLRLTLLAPRAVQRDAKCHVGVPNQLPEEWQQRAWSTCQWPVHCCSSGSNRSRMRWCPSAPPTSWGMFLPTGSRAASSGWRYWGQPCCWWKTEALLASVCGAESDCRRRTRRFTSGGSHCVTTDTRYLPPPPARSCFFSFFFSIIRTRRDLKRSKSLLEQNVLSFFQNQHFCREDFSGML